MKKAFPSRRTRIALPGIAALLLATAAWAQGPIPDPIAPSGLTVGLVDFAQIPPSSGSRPLARLNLLSHAGDGSGRLFVNDLNGKLWIIKGGSVLPTPFLDAKAVLGIFLRTNASQWGLSTFAFHPDYARAHRPGYGKLYTVTHEIRFGMPDFTTPFAAVTHHNVLSEWSVDPNDPDRIDPSARRVILIVEGHSTDHPMGQVAFNPNAGRRDRDRGILYVSLGDGGGYRPSLGIIDPFGVSQDRTNPYGSILRIDPFGASTRKSPTHGAYGIPRDNPYVGNAEGFLQEIWAYGLRNPHRFSWDTGGDGKMLVSDIGQANLEEVNVGRADANYGWSEREGTLVMFKPDQFAIVPLPPDDAIYDYTYPVAQYDHDEGAAIVGGFVYRGRRIPELYGHYVFGDIRNGRIFHVPVDDLIDGSQATVQSLGLVRLGVPTTVLNEVRRAVGASRADLRFGSSEDGEIYVLTKQDGRVRALARHPSTACTDGLDTDGDGLIDFEDPGCADVDDDSERAPRLACDNGEDDDGDDLTDFPDDPDCRGPSWPSERSDCRNGMGSMALLPLLFLARRRG